MNSNSRPTGLLRRATIDLGALTRNISARAESLRGEAAAGTNPLVTVDGRANAYGLGIDVLERASAAAGATVSTSGVADIGVEVYGFSTGETVLTVSAEVVATKRIKAGTGVSYGYTYSAADDTNIALICLGFADGLPRSASNSGGVSIGGRRFREVGRIAMDQFVIELGQESVRIGDEVVIFGSPALGNPGISEWADAAALAPEQLAARLGSRITREVIGD